LRLSRNWWGEVLKVLSSAALSFLAEAAANLALEE